MRISDWSSDVCSSDLERQHEEFKDRVGEIITGVVKSVEFGHVVVNLGRAEGVIRRDQQIPRDRKSVVSGKSVSVRVDLGGRRIIKKKKTQQHKQNKFALTCTL